MEKTAKYINRELSWLEFNQRVLDEACNADNPLLERLKFLSITASNLDEFIMVRVGGLQIMVQEGRKKRDISGLTPIGQLKAISKRTREMVKLQYDCYLKDLEPALNGAGIQRIHPHALSREQTDYVSAYFNDELFPILTPMAVDLNSDFPLLPNLTLCLAVRIAPAKGEKEERFALLPFGRSINRFITLPAEKSYTYMLIEDIAAIFMDRWFPGVTVIENGVFRITRNADMNVCEDLAADLMLGMEGILDARKQSECVRLEIDRSASDEIIMLLRNALNVAEQDIYRITGPQDLAGFQNLAFMDGFEQLKDESWPPCSSPAVDPRESIFETMGRKNILLVHPYESFDPVIRFINDAADDPDVLAIKQTLYRMSSRSPVVDALFKAVHKGKHVTALIELKARFDEARNIEWAKQLEQEGVQVIYGVKGLKTHSKITIVVRREPQGLVRYMHFGTGNYNESTAKIYSDISYMTCDNALGSDASAFFNAITGFSQPIQYNKLHMAPLGIRDALVELIENEIERRRQGQDALIMAKMNSLADPPLIDKLYEASLAGVKVLLNIRGICCLRAGVPGLSENITVVSIVDRFLEHARLFYFQHGGARHVYISSADWMPRNLDRRIELLVPIEDRAARKRLIAILKLYFKDTSNAWVLNPDDTFQRRRPRRKEDRLRAQEVLYREVAESVEQAQQERNTLFEPHRPMDDSGI